MERPPTGEPVSVRNLSSRCESLLRACRQHARIVERGLLAGLPIQEALLVLNASPASLEQIRAIVCRTGN